MFIGFILILIFDPDGVEYFLIIIFYKHWTHSGHVLQACGNEESIMRSKFLKTHSENAHNPRGSRVKHEMAMRNSLSHH